MRDNPTGSSPVADRSWPSTSTVGDPTTFEPWAPSPADVPAPPPELTIREATTRDIEGCDALARLVSDGPRWRRDEPKPVIIVSNDRRNRSRFEWVHVVRITTRPKRSLPTIVELSVRDAPLTGRAMTDELELVRKADLEDRRGMLSSSTMAAMDHALRDVLALH